ncbi:tRNA-Phe hydroxylase [Aureococcus anophagefferens]|nr:tRNA-Phe hydroxylase [Aureococcus anophagefferens]
MDLVQRRVDVYSPRERRWAKGRIAAYRRKSGEHRVDYEAGGAPTWLDLSAVRHRFLDASGARYEIEYEGRDDADGGGGAAPAPAGRQGGALAPGRRGARGDDGAAPRGGAALLRAGGLRRQRGRRPRLRAAGQARAAAARRRRRAPRPAPATPRRKRSARRRRVAGGAGAAGDEDVAARGGGGGGAAAAPPPPPRRPPRAARRRRRRDAAAAAAAEDDASAAPLGYCYCGDGSGDMVGCDAEEACQRGWFHAECLEAAGEAAPGADGGWFCRDCRGGGDGASEDSGGYCVCGGDGGGAMVQRVRAALADVVYTVHRAGRHRWRAPERDGAAIGRRAAVQAVLTDLAWRVSLAAAVGDERAAELATLRGLRERFLDATASRLAHDAPSFGRANHAAAAYARSAAGRADAAARAEKARKRALRDLAVRPQFPTAAAAAPPRPRDFLAVLVKREGLRLAKARGDPWPWSDDAVLNAHKFTNVKREHDRATRWLRRAWTAGHAAADAATVLFNCAAFRAFGTVAEKRAEGPEAPPADVYARTAAKLGELPAALAGLVAARGGAKLTWQALALRLREVSGFGGSGFMAKEVLHDAMGWASLRALVVDGKDWTPPGPGGRRGLNRLHGRPRDLGALAPAGSPCEERFIAEMVLLKDALYDLDRPFCDRVGLDVHDVQFQLCEYDKYARCVDGGRGGAVLPYTPVRGSVTFATDDGAPPDGLRFREPDEEWHLARTRAAKAAAADDDDDEA